LFIVISDQNLNQFHQIFRFFQQQTPPTFVCQREYITFCVSFPQYLSLKFILGEPISFSITFQQTTALFVPSSCPSLLLTSLCPSPLDSVSVCLAQSSHALFVCLLSSTKAKETVQKSFYCRFGHISQHSLPVESPPLSTCWSPLSLTSSLHPLSIITGLCPFNLLSGPYPFSYSIFHLSPSLLPSSLSPPLISSKQKSTSALCLSLFVCFSGCHDFDNVHPFFILSLSLSRFFSSASRTFFAASIARHFVYFRFLSLSHRLLPLSQLSSSQYRY
jgi:hypothetical protein